jgi:hypothetical protein
MEYSSKIIYKNNYEMSQTQHPQTAKYSISLHACLGTRAYISSESTDMLLPLLAGEDFCNFIISSCCKSSSDSHPPPAWPGTCAGRVRIAL